MDIQKKRLILKISMIVLLCGAVVSVIGIIVTGSQYTKSKAEYKKLEQYVKVEVPVKEKADEVVATEPIPVEEEEEVAESMIDIDFDMDFDALKAINSDLVGWVYYEPLELSYPIVVDKGDDFYENHSFELERNLAGAIFMDYLCKTDMTSFNTIIYGHNMRNDTMFGALNKLLDKKSIIEENPYFYVFTKDEAMMYEIVAAYYTQNGSQTYDLSLDYTLDDMEDYFAYMNEVAEYRNEDFFSKGIDENTKLFTMSTCHGLHSTSRTVIQGVMIAREPRG